jgi:hypothetical protein
MGVSSTTVLEIICDNPACPGNDLNPESYEGWIQLTAQVTPVAPVAPEGALPSPLYFPIQSTAIYCSSSCASSVGAALDAAEDARNAPPEPAPEA